MQASGCRAAGEWLLRAPDGGLLPQERAALEHHLLTCASCRRRVELLEDAAKRLQRPGVAAPGFADRVLRRLAEGRSAEARSGIRPQIAIRPWLAAAAAALLVVSALSLWKRNPAAAPEAAGPPRVLVELELAAAAGRSVAVAGDFNGWDAARMQRGEDGVWRIRLSLAPGRYQYVFVVDGEQWIADPRAATVVDNGFSGTNSVLDVSL